ncbi:hypothetical protein G7Z17_g2821 [Cylindrodendrum hubeiense]|uniref:SUN domain-containing protein n=1 Tax=Cylindrodendrum hubeiense TaxID=595255 RepID=A0A9P5LE27_9HYPO|nr:hypothetical protein G7Z17_g2821 [Cylindrodendrum hubeiense]
MPPRPSSIRRSARFSSREPEPEASHDRVGNLVRPQLPALAGTPSSRRQLSYGSAAEPPRRPGGGLQRVDIGNAVSQALQRNDEDEVFVRPRRPQRSATADDEDELAGDHRRMKALDLSPAVTLDPPGYIFTGSDADSMRSFGLENDYYGDATIESTPGSTPVPDPRQTARPPSRQPQQSNLERVAEERLPEPSPKKTADARSTAAAKSRPERAGVGQRVGKTQPEQQPPQPEQDSEEDDEDEQGATNALMGHQRKTNTPAPNRMRQASTRQLKSQKMAAAQQVEAERERQSQSQDRQTRTSALAPSVQDDAGPSKTNRRDLRSTAAQPPAQDTGDSRKTLRINGRVGGRSLFSQANELNKKTTSFDTNTYPADAWERDAAIQRDILEAEEQVAREREVADRREARRQQWLWLMSLWPLPLLRRLFGIRSPTDDEDEEEDDDLTGPTEWSRLLNPMTYVQTFIWLIDKIMDHFVGLIDKISGIDLHVQIPRPGKTFGWVVAGLFGLFIAAFFGPAIILGLKASSPSMPHIGMPSMPHVGMPNVGGIRWPNVGGIIGKAGGLIPSISWPSWPSRSKSEWDDLSDLWKSDDKAHEKADKMFKEYAKDLITLKKAAKIHDASLQKLKTVIPKIVHMELDNGKPVVTQEFWHALRDLIHEDGGFLTVEKKGSDYEFTSEEQWQAIVGRLNKDPTFASKLKVSVAGIENRLDSKMSGVWDAWVKNNEDKIAELVGPALDKIQSAGSGREFDERLSRIVKEQLRSKEIKETIVTREDFLHHLQKEFATHRTEIRAELNALQPQLEELRESIRRATENTPQGVTKTEVNTLVRSLVLKAIADMNLEAMAKGKIHFHWDAELKNQVNYFGVGAGATVDAKRTSATYDPFNKGIILEAAFKKGIRGAEPYPAIAALNPWQDEGDCWCAARSVNHRGNPHGAALSVQLAHHIIPQHVVVEHILPGATTDPDARPRHIEVYAHFADGAVLARWTELAAAKRAEIAGKGGYDGVGELRDELEGLLGWSGLAYF